MNDTNEHNSETALEVHELTDAELDIVSGGTSGGTAGGTVTAKWDIVVMKRV